MVKRDPDDLLSAVSKYLKNQENSVLRLTFKRGGQWEPRFAKAHSRKAKKIIKQQIKQKVVSEQQQFPLLARVKIQRQQKQRRNVQLGLNKGLGFIQSIMNIFRVNFFKKNNQGQQKHKNQPTKPKINSKSTLKKQQKKKRNLERRLKRNEINRKLKKQQRDNKKILI